MKRLSVAPTTSEQTEEPFSVAPPRNPASPSHNANATLQDSEYPTAMDLLEALFPARRIDEAAAESVEAKNGQLETR
jgi:hypothetical protein